MMGLSAKLSEKRGEKSATILLFSVLEIKVIIGDGSQSSCMYGFDVLYDRRTGHRHKPFQQKVCRDTTHQRMLLPDPAAKPEIISNMAEQLWKTSRFPWVHRRVPVAFHSL